MKVHQMIDDGTVSYKTKHRMDLITPTPNFRPVDMEFCPRWLVVSCRLAQRTVGHMQHNDETCVTFTVKFTELLISSVKNAKVAGASASEI
jgi:hypothetical protein